MIGKTILYTGRCRKNAIVSESFDCQEEERIDLLPEVTDKRWLPAFFSCPIFIINKVINVL